MIDAKVSCRKWSPTWCVVEEGSSKYWLLQYLIRLLDKIFERTGWSIQDVAHRTLIFSDGWTSCFIGHRQRLLWRKSAVSAWVHWVYGRRNSSEHCLRQYLIRHGLALVFTFAWTSGFIVRKQRRVWRHPSMRVATQVTPSPLQKFWSFKKIINLF